MEFCEVLEQLVSRIENNLVGWGVGWGGGGASEKKIGGEGYAVTLVVSGFHFFQDSNFFIKP